MSGSSADSRTRELAELAAVVVGRSDSWWGMGHGDREDEAHIGEGCVMEVMEHRGVDNDWISLLN